MPEYERMRLYSELTSWYRLVDPVADHADEAASYAAGFERVLGSRPATLLAGRRLILITKGDLIDQERKIAASGLADRFEAIEILADKSPETYARVLWRAGVAAGAFVMAGNSMKSDVLPVVTLGGHGVFIPHDLTWVLEQAEPADHPRLHRLDGIAGLPALIDRLDHDDA